MAHVTPVQGSSSPLWRKGQAWEQGPEEEVIHEESDKEASNIEPGQQEGPEEHRTKCHVWATSLSHAQVSFLWPDCM